MSTLVCNFQTINGQSCVVCPEQPAIPATADQIVVNPRYGWNASAYSALQHEGNCYTQFTLPAVMGAVIGLAPQRRSNDPHDVPYAFYAYKASGAEYWVVLEAGVPVTAPVLRDVGTDVFRIERRGSVVTYFHNSKVKHVSAVPVAPGALVVVACMYAANDGVD